MAYSAPLDGIRAIAILAVLVFHIEPSALRGGFVGVDVFFVLSGFLISSVILHDVAEGTFSFREFYLRRVQRLLPNAMATVLAALVLWTIFLPPSAAAQAGRHGVWALFNLSNFYIWKNLGGYWGEAAESAPLLHTWSLGVEEQFYFVFPATLVVLARVQRTRMSSWLAAAGAVSFALCVYSTRVHQAAAFYLLPTRIWELLLGAVLAARRSPLAERATHGSGARTAVLEWVGWAGVGAIVISMFVVDDAGFPGSIALLPTVGTALVIVAAADGKTKLADLLARPFMVWTGKLSYSLYLWHWPLITLGKMEAERAGLPPLAGAVAGGVAGALLAVGAYFAIEKPLRFRGRGRRWQFAAIGAGFAVVTAGAYFVANPRDQPDLSARFDPPTFRGFLYSVRRLASHEGARNAVRFRDVLFPPLTPLSVDVLEHGIVHAWGDGLPRVVVLGSSHALMYSRVIDDVCHELRVTVAFLGADETPVFFKETVNEAFPTRRDAEAFDALRMRVLREWHPDAIVIADRWDIRAQDGATFGEDLRSFLKVVGPLAGRVLFLSQVPVVSVGESVNLREYVAWRWKAASAPPRLLPDRNERVRERVIAQAESIARDFPNLRVVRADRAFLTDEGSIRWGTGRTFYYADDDHLTDAGTEVVRELFRSAIDEATSVAKVPRGSARELSAVTSVKATPPRSDRTRSLIPSTSAP